MCWRSALELIQGSTSSDVINGAAVMFALICTRWSRNADLGTSKGRNINVAAVDGAAKMFVESGKIQRSQ